MTQSTHNFKKAIQQALSDDYLQQALNTYPVQRTCQVQEILNEFPDLQKLRDLARRIKDYTIDHLDELLSQLADQMQSLGGHVHFASDDQHARQIILDITRQHQSRLCIKSKSMVTEEINLSNALIENGVETVETDLGEFIIQLAQERPSHIISPCLHVSRQKVAQLFHDHLNVPYTEDENELTLIARRCLRDKFQHADLGITGVNLAVAQTASLAIITNEGNGRFCTAGPPVQIAVMGLEKIVPNLTDLAVMLKLIARNAVGTRTSVYTSIITGPARPGEIDGPQHLHLVILDNGRTNVLASPYRQLLRCLRCGACMNTCPVYRKIGGHAYGFVYPGPIGAALMPIMKSYHPSTHMLPELSSLCGACQEVCPVMIDLPRLLINHRRDLVKQQKSSLLYRFGLTVLGWFHKHPARYRFYQRASRLCLRLLARDGWVRRVPPPASAWTKNRDLPVPPKHSFANVWSNTKGKP